MTKTNIILKETQYDESFEYRMYDITDGQNVIGQAQVMYNEGDEVEAYIERMDIDEEYRNAGHGTAATQLLVEEYGEVFAAPDNEDSQRLLERIGEDASNLDTADYLDQGYGFYRI